MNDVKILHCCGCGATLDVEMNKSFVFCKYCGAKNIIDSQQMKSNVNFGNINISANIETDNLIQTAEYAISVGDLQKASELLISAVMSGNSDYRVYICKAKIALQTDNIKSLFESLEKLEQIEKTTDSEEIRTAVKELMSYRGKNGFIALHNASFHERLDLVKFCVEHGADVNCHAGKNNVTPITILYVPIDPKTQTKLDGTPFVRNKGTVKQIREYLKSTGAIDSKSAFKSIVRLIPFVALAACVLINIIANKNGIVTILTLIAAIGIFGVWFNKNFGVKKENKSFAQNKNSGDKNENTDIQPNNNSGEKNINKGFCIILVLLAVIIIYGCN